MVKLEDIRRGIQLRGIIPNQIVTIRDIEQHGSDALEVLYKASDGRVGTQILYRDHEARLEEVVAIREWRFEADGDLLRLVSEAHRIHLAHLFDPVLAVHTSLIEPLPHQITAVYGEMLVRQPLRYLLADDPGAGKTVMAGLLIKELLVRGDVKRCMVVAPGNLVNQWRDELWQKFQLPFDVLTMDMVEAARTGNIFTERDLLIVRLDQVSRSDYLQEKLHARDWDLVICDESHKMAASFFGGELRETRRFRLGKLLSAQARHFLLMTATPHNGREADFQLFMSLLDPDRFESHFREGVTPVDVSDMMRRMVKERLLRFDGRPLFPERRAYTIDYTLSDREMSLYEAVTAYVRQEFNRADQLEEGRRGTVGFALTSLQRRLASSPLAIYRSLQNRRKRLETRVQDERDWQAEPFAEVDDPDEWTSDEAERVEQEVTDRATAAQTIAELEAEIATIKRLEPLALTVLNSRQDRKWDELSRLLQAEQEMFKADGRRHKIVIFSEFRDTLEYLHNQIGTLLGGADRVAVIYGGMRDRARVQAEFENNPDVIVLVATDAAGEGINLHHASHLMVNYDLPWNPNRIEQRFGRIHRIGQQEVCHLWNLVAGDTREGEVYQRLLRKISNERGALQGQVFDVLGRLFEDTPLPDLLIEAVRYGDRPEVRARLEQAVDNAVDQDHIRSLLEANSLAQQAMDLSEIAVIRDDMERAAARRLQPHYIRSFFLQGFERLGGTIAQREAGRYQITHVPAVIRNYDGATTPIARQYERICFDKRLIHMAGKPSADFVAPGHPLLEAVIGLLLRQNSDVLAQGAILVDPTDASQTPRVLYYLQQDIRDAQRVVSREIHFMELTADGEAYAAGTAPYLDYRPLTEQERERLKTRLDTSWTDDSGFESRIISYAVEQLIPRHLARIRERREPLIDKTLRAVQARLTKEINYWDRRAVQLRQAERDGRLNARLNSEKAKQRANDLSERLQRRKAELADERQIAPVPPVIVGRALIVPAGLLYDPAERESLDTRITEQIAMQAVQAAELALGNDPCDVSDQKLGYDIESRDGQTGQLRFIEVKGRRAGADTVTITRNELLTALNKPDKYILALVEIVDGQARQPRYVRQPFSREPDFAVTSVNYNLNELLARSEEP